MLMFKKLGIQIDAKDLDVIDVQILRIISNVQSEVEQAKMDKMAKEQQLAGKGKGPTRKR